MSATSSVLSGLSLATGVARDAADGVPVVKQLLGVAARVVSLAQHIDKNRTDLHALADRAKRMDAAIEAALGDREPDGHMLRRLEDMNATLRAIERRFAKHVKRGRVRRVLEYMFTVQHEIERLQGEFDDRLGELQVAANVEATLVAKENSRFIGEFRNVRHCEISLLRRIATQSQTEDGFTITCDLATCEGSNQIFIVRSVVVSRRDEDPCRSVDHHEKILEELSFIQNRHPVVPYLYGRNNGPRNNRFAVLCTGDVRPLKDILSAGRAPLSILGPIVAKLVDASCHLRNFGVTWRTPSVTLESIYLDEKGQPKIGLLNDLSETLLRSDWQAENLTDTMTEGSAACGILNGSTSSCMQEIHLPRNGFRSELWHKQLFGSLLDAGYRTTRIENIVRRADISGVIPFTHESLAFLRLAEKRIGVPASLWGNILLRLAMGSRKWEGSMLRAIHVPKACAEYDSILALCVEDDGETVRTVETVIRISGLSVEDISQRFGFPEFPWEDPELVIHELVRLSRRGETLVECTGWSNKPPTECFRW